jgi:transcriptional regulator GlxA family with amidase domain
MILDLRLQEKNYMQARKRNVGILIFDDVEVLDFCGPFEVFATTTLPESDRQDSEAKPFNVFTIAEKAEIVKCRGGLLVQPHFTIENHPTLDILVIPGGFGTRREARNARLLDWIALQDKTTELTTSVCTGAFLLAARGLLDNLPATTHWGSLERLQASYPSISVRSGIRYVDNGHIITSAGVSAGIDMSLHVVARLLGEATALETAKQMEYESRIL